MDRPLRLPTDPKLLVTEQAPFIHRDMSWLQFNQRVMAESTDGINPLLERAKFLAISSSNLDEFFMIRFASMNRALDHFKRHNRTDKLQTSQRHREQVLAMIAEFIQTQEKILGQLAKALEPHQIHLQKDDSWSEEALALGKACFDEQVLPLLSQPIPFGLKEVLRLENLQLGVAFDKKTWMPIPKTVPSAYARSTALGDKVYLFFLDDLLMRFLGPALGLSVVPAILRLTRDADVTVDLEEEDSESILDVVRTGIAGRERRKGVRLQSRGNVPKALLQRLLHQLRLDAAQAFVIPASSTLCLHGLWSATQQIPEPIRARPELTYAPIKAVIPSAFYGDHSIFYGIRERDLLFHHPYDSFDAFVSWIQTSCKDPNVESIEMTIYRTDALSPIIPALQEAAQSGKRVRVMIELRARFDELNNLQLSEKLRQSGVQVAYGFGKLKLHAKIALVTRREKEGLRTYTHLSTGNYHSVTARQYTDLAILTANPEIGEDAHHFFDSVFEEHVPKTFKRLVSAPLRLHLRLKHLIAGETAAARSGQPARIFVKVNALVDEKIIESLYEASQAGVKVDLVIRGACALIPGVPGLSENIRVLSVVDRFLEHSRIYYFESSKALYLSSADWMPRNFYSRLELAFPVLDDRIFRYLRDNVMPTYLRDNVKARELSPEGHWIKRAAEGKELLVRSQFVFEEWARAEYRGTPLEWDTQA